MKSNNNNVTCIRILIQFLQNEDGVKDELILANECC